MRHALSRIGDPRKDAKHVPSEIEGGADSSGCGFNEGRGHRSLYSCARLQSVGLSVVARGLINVFVGENGGRGWHGCVTAVDAMPEASSSEESGALVLHAGSVQGPPGK